MIALPLLMMITFGVFYYLSALLIGTVPSCFQQNTSNSNVLIHLFHFSPLGTGFFVFKFLAIFITNIISIWEELDSKYFKPLPFFLICFDYHSILFYSILIYSILLHSCHFGDWGDWPVGWLYRFHLDEPFGSQWKETLFAPAHLLNIRRRGQLYTLLCCLQYPLCKCTCSFDIISSPPRLSG